MGRKKKRRPARQEPAANEPQSPMPWGRMGALVLAIIVVSVVAHSLLRRDRLVPVKTSTDKPVASAASEPEPADTPEKDETPAPTEEPGGVDLSKLAGKWRRTDAVYQIEMKNIDKDGGMEAAYFNPQPIRVSKAQATQEGGTAKVFIELNDVGYPGCTYDLDYDAENDTLRGVYFQAAMQQRFEVVFERM